MNQFKKEVEFDPINDPLYSALKKLEFKLLKALQLDVPFIFISHKHGEVDYVYRLQKLLEQYGFTGYVDWEDDTMPKDTSGETAIKLKDTIKKSRKFILIATEAAIASKWCNWEIGFADAHKYIDNIALLPLQKDNLAYTGEEYLQLYPSIQVKSNMQPSQYYILYLDGKKLSIEDWLKFSDSGPNTNYV